GGGQAGQIGNLGGQFGFQGQTFENHLVRLITDTIARGRWARVPVNLQIAGQGGTDSMDEDAAVIPADEKFSLGFYPPALALVVNAPSRFRPTVKYSRESAGAAGGGGMAVRPVGGADAIANINDIRIKDKNQLANAKDEMAGAKPRKLVT